MAHSTLITDYLGFGTHAARPASPNVPGAALYTETDTGNTYVWDGTSWVLIAGVSTSVNFADNEVPVDSGDHQNYTLAHSPSPAGSLELFINGQLLSQGIGLDYTLTGNAIALSVAGDGTDKLQAWYRY